MKRPNGDAYLYFRTLDEVNEALTYDRKYMGIILNKISFKKKKHTYIIYC